MVKVSKGRARREGILMSRTGYEEKLWHEVYSETGSLVVMTK